MTQVPYKSVRGSRDDPVRLSWWLPRLQAAGVPVPRTLTIEVPRPAREAFWAAMDGGELEDAGVRFVNELAELAGSASWGLPDRPVFLRTDYTSGKHEWSQTCFVADAAELALHVMRLIEYSELTDAMGLPCDVFAVREYLDVQPLAVCRSYFDMPVVREFRFFVEDGEVVCRHPYWPEDALAAGDPDMPASLLSAALELTNSEVEGEMAALARAAGRAVGGFWSVDVLQAEDGWFVTDMAPGELSWHWPGCEHAAAE